jgi:hypothetical protein
MAAARRARGELVPVVIPELVAVIGLFFAVVGYLAARGLLATWTHSLGFVLQWMGTHLRIRIPLPHIRDIHIDVGRPFREADHAIITALQTWAAGAEIEMGFFLHGAGRLAALAAEATDILARETSETFEWLVHRHIPRWVKLAIEAAFPLTWLHKIIAEAIAHAIPAVRKEIHSVTHEVTHEVTHIVRRAAPVVLPIPLGLPHIRAQIRGLTRRNLRITKRLHRLEGLLGVAAMAAAMANVLGLPNWRCLTRGNIGRAARHFCGLDKWLVDLLLLGSVEAFVATDLCEFTHLLGIAAKAQRPALMELVSVENALVGCHGTTSPPLFVLPSADLPPLQGASPLAA